jgi:hypothetical protein
MLITEINGSFSGQGPRLIHRDERRPDYSGSSHFVVYRSPKAISRA